MDYRTVTATEMRYINRSAILEVIRNRQVVSRTYLAKHLQISLPTVMRIVDELIEEGLVCPHQESEWSGGRRRSLVEYNGDAHVVIGVNLGGTNLFGAAANLRGEILDEIDLPVHNSSGEDSFNLLVDLIQKLLSSPKLLGRNVRGIGIGAPGMTDPKQGVVLKAPLVDWTDYPLKARLSKLFAPPIFVESGVNLAAQGEYWFGAGKNSKVMVFLAVGTTLGSAILINGELYRGARDGAGGVGFLLPGREYLWKQFDNYGALDTLASGNGIAQRAVAFREQLGIPDTSANLTAETIFKLARQKEKWAVAMVDEITDYLSLAVGNISALFDPDVIVFGGGISRSADMFIQPVAERLQGSVPCLPRLVASPLGHRGAAMGAINTVLHNTTEFFVIHQLS